MPKPITDQQIEDAKQAMNRQHHEALQRIATALGLTPGDDIHHQAPRAIDALKADNNWLREVVGVLVTLSPESAQRLSSLVRESVPMHSLEALEREYDELRRQALTPTMEAIIQQVHDAAGKGDVDDGIVIQIPISEYDALCEEEYSREALIRSGG